MAYFAKKGSILIALVLAVALSLTAISFFTMIGGRTAFTVNQLKRAQAINYAEVALYEAFNLFRTGQLDRSSNQNTTILINSVPVAISYIEATGAISATVNCDDINMGT